MTVSDLVAKQLRFLHHIVTFVLLVLLSTTCLWRFFANTLTLSLRRDEYTHIALILPICAALLWVKWNSLKSALSWDWRAGVFLASAAIMIFLASSVFLPLTPDQRLATGMLSLVILWIAGFVLCFGMKAARALLFPLGFLFWMIPLPSVVVTSIVQVLQRGSAILTALFFQIAAVPISRDGVILTIPGLTIEVAKECSSIRSSLMLLVTTMVLAHVLLRSTWRKVIVVLIAIPLSLAKNAVRIFTIATLGTQVDPGFLTGHLHHDGGVVFFGLTLGVILLVIWRLRRTEATAWNMPKRQIEKAIPVG